MKFWEPDKSASARGGKGGPGLNVLLITDCEKLIHGRRGLGPWSLDIAEAIFDVAAPRVIARASQRGKDAAAVLQGWMIRWLPDLVEAEGVTWVHRRFLELRDQRYGSFRKIDEIANDLGITQDEVLGFRLEAMVSKDRPPAVRKKDRQTADAVYQKAKRAAEGATARDMSLAARHRRGEFGTVSLKTIRRQIVDGKRDPITGAEMPSDVPVSSDVHFSSATVLTCSVEDEKCPRRVSAETTNPLEIDQIERETPIERFKLVAADYVKGPALQPTIPTPVRAKILAMPLSRAA